MSGLEFTEKAARQLERLYLTRDVVAQRPETIKQLSLSQGERVLDIGCGPGFLCESMADIVGRDGTVIGIDISSDFVALCKRRTPPKWLSYEVGDATQLAQPDASFDAVVCTQVAEYIPNVNRTLAGQSLLQRTGMRSYGTRERQIAWHWF
jgi:arsenite methyltransferase